MRTKKITAKIVLAALFLALGACGSDDTAAPNGPRFYKAQGGVGSPNLLLVGVYETDNQVSAYSFYKPCNSTSTTMADVHSSSSNKPIAGNKLNGPNMSSNSCDMDADYIFSGGQLSAVGTLDATPINVPYLEISEAEFITILNSSTIGLKNKLGSSSMTASKQKRYDDVCQALFEGNCSTVIK